MHPMLDSAIPKPAQILLNEDPKTQRAKAQTDPESGLSLVQIFEDWPDALCLNEGESKI